MRKHLSTVVLILVLLTGLSLLLYPTVSDFWNSMHQSRAIASYSETVTQLTPRDYEQYFADARAYNGTLADNPTRFLMSDEQRARYDALLNISGNGIMGYINIPLLGCTLPIYHGTDEAVLQVAVGHIEGSSLPVGGAGTHCVLSGHRGLPSAELFTRLDRMGLGDTFMLHVLGEVLTYEVDQILVVEPEDVSALAIDPQQDYCTLVTCTPYGINTHRLLVRGHRVQTLEEAAPVQLEADAVEVSRLAVAPFLTAALLALWGLVRLLRRLARR